jgi:hypothetical protein
MSVNKFVRQEHSIPGRTLKPTFPSQRRSYLFSSCIGVLGVGLRGHRIADAMLNMLFENLIFLITLIHVCGVSVWLVVADMFPCSFYEIMFSKFFLLCLL